ncbi:MAG: hypothetical protein KatS3mg128_0700 [Silanimonas sp.]|nr:MAG: hypothetical protein KatS3mg128_0700 [Silanimonas sp.]
MTKHGVNSKGYWEQRFKEDWDAAGGPEQTRFFAETALRLMPGWLRRDLKSDAWSIADIGCAEGEAAALLKQTFPNTEVVGLDFSSAAIEVAKTRYPDVRFEVADLNEFEGKFDVTFCSNVLEHFHDPMPVMRRIARATARHFILLVPGWEQERHHEHHVTFDLSGLPLVFEGLTLTHLDAVNCARINPRQWPGFQLIAIYTRQDLVESLGLLAADMVASALLPGMDAEDIGKIISCEAALKGGQPRLLQASSIAGIEARLAEIVSRQEAIGFNTRAELQQAFVARIDELKSAIPEILEARSPDFSALSSTAHQALELGRGLELRLASMLEMLQERDVQIAGSRERITTLEEALSERDRDLVLARERMSALEARITACHEQIGSARAREDTLGRLASDTAAALAASIEQQKATKQLLEQRDLELERLRAELAVREEELENSRRGWGQEASAFRSDISLLEAKIHALSAELNERRGREDWLRTELQDKDEKMKQMEQAMAALGSRMDALIQEFSRKDGQRERELAELRLECEGLRRAFSLLEEDRERFAALADRYRQQLQSVYSSNSWRLTAPWRRIKSAVSGVDPAAPIEFMPSPLHIDPASFIPPASCDNGNGGSVLSSAVAQDGRDLSWEEFHERVLSRREQYRGVFIQELVIDWNVPLYQRPQHIATAMSRLGFLVIYRTDNWGGDDVDGFREVLPNVWVTNSSMTDGIEGAVRSVYSTAYAHQPELLSQRPASSVMVYEYIDHIDPQISGEPENIRRLLALKDWAFGGGADIVVASARKLHEEAVDAVGEAKVILAQNGVDTRHYRNPAQQKVPVPQALLNFRERFGTVVGYFGAIAPWLWYEAIEELVRSRPDLGFVFIGPDYYGGVERLPKGDNVLYLGTVDYRVLPGHAHYFDVCFIPFAPGEIARTTSPLKLFEYFALEKPVVVTAEMLECVAYPEVFRGSSAVEFSAAIDAACMVKDSAAFRARLAQLADENDWDRRAEAMARAFALLHAKQ